MLWHHSSSEWQSTVFSRFSSILITALPFHQIHQDRWQFLYPILHQPSWPLSWEWINKHNSNLNPRQKWQAVDLLPLLLHFDAHSKTEKSMCEFQSEGCLLNGGGGCRCCWIKHLQIAGWEDEAMCLTYTLLFLFSTEEIWHSFNSSLKG